MYRVACLLPINSFDYAAQYPVAIEAIAAGLADGSIKQKMHIVEGLEKAPEALPMLYTGGNTGKLSVQYCSFFLADYLLTLIFFPLQGY